MGRCLADEIYVAPFMDDPLYLGCSTDVLHLMDKKCSGRNACSITNQDPDLAKERPCHRALYMYADYRCVTG